MKQILRIAKTELQVLFYSPVAWFILIIFAFQSGLFYFQYLSGYADMMEYRGAISDGTFGLFVEQRGNPTFLLKVMSYLFYFIPLLTMGVISRELSSGSIKLLYSSPVTNTQIVLGKFFSIVAYALVMVGVLFMYVVHASFIIDNFDWTFLPVSLLGIFLLICAYGAVGVYMSSLTSYQMVAALGTLVVLTLFNYVGDFWQTIEFVREITYWLGMNGRAESFITGILCSEDVLYFIVVISLFLSLTIFRLMNKREKKSKLRVCTLYMTLFAVVISVAYLSSRPSLMAYWDATRFERNTLTVGSQEVVEGLEGDIEVVTYVNIYDTPNVVWRVSPRYEVNDMQQNYGQYRRYKPQIDMKYVYYASTKGIGYADLRKNLPDLKEDELLEKMCKRFDISRKRVLTEEQVLEIEPDIAKEQFRSLKIVTMEDGKKGYIRYFNDMNVLPAEGEISAGFKRAITDVYPKVAFVEGHEERSIELNGDKNYSNFTNKFVRSSLYNQGFDVSKITLDKAVPSDINIVVIADPRTEFTKEELVNYQEYVDRGGNLVVLGEPHRNAIVNKLTEQFGVKLKDGILVKPTKEDDPDLIVTRPIHQSSPISYFIKSIAKQPYYCFGFPTSAELDYVTTKGFFVTPIAVTDTTGGAWTELQTRYFEEEKPKHDPETEGEIRASIPVMVALNRLKDDGGEQKIIISGDADCFSSAELSESSHMMHFTKNAMLVFGAFNWLSDGQSPIDVRRPAPIDNKFALVQSQVDVHRIIFMWGIPILMLIFAVIINIRRRAK